MDGPSALLLPIAIAAYSGWQQHKSCIGEKHDHPVAEEFCSNLRRGIDDTCKAGLSLPVHNQIALTVGKKIEYVKFDVFMKEVLAQTYSACTKFWEDNPNYGFEQYRLDIDRHASVLSILLKKIPPSKRTDYDYLQQSLVAQGATLRTSNADVEQTMIEICKDTDSCDEKSEELPPDATFMGLAEGLESVRKHIDDRLGERNQELKDYIDTKIAQLESTKKPVDRVIAKGSAPAYGLIAEVGFSAGDYRISRETCQSIATQVEKALSGRHSLHIVAHADHRGEVSFNRALSMRRAESVADCLHSAINLPLNLRKEGRGAIWTHHGDMQVARRASVYLRALPPENTPADKKIAE